MTDLNRRPTIYETVALPTELMGQIDVRDMAVRQTRSLDNKMCNLTLCLLQAVHRATRDFISTYLFF
jgi:hypothetical protein